MEWWALEEAAEWGRDNPPPRRRPLVGLAVAVLTGTALGLQVAFPAGGVLIAALSAVGVLLFCIRRRWSAGVLWSVLFALAAVHARLSVEDPFRADTLTSMIPRRMEYVQFVAVMREDAVRRTPRPGRQSTDVVVDAEAVALNRDGRWWKVSEKVRVVLRGMPEEGMDLPRYGERWVMQGVVRPGARREMRQNMWRMTQAMVDFDRARRWDAGHGNPVMQWCVERRRACREVLSLGLERHPEERGILQALLLGYREDLPEALRDDFRATGTVHIFAISGAHVGMVMTLWIGVLIWLGIPKTRWFWWVAPVLVAYTLATGAAVSAIRACLMALFVLAAPCVRRRPDAVSALLAAALLIVGVAPMQLMDLGFILSFTAVGALIGLVPWFEWRLHRMFYRDEWMLPMAERRAGRWGRWLGLETTRALSVSFSAWMGTGPLTAYSFNLFSPIALGMNLVVIPLVFCILSAGVLSLVGSATGTFLPEVFNHAARVLAGVLAAGIRWASQVPGGHWFIRSPPLALVVGGYALLLIGVCAGRRRNGIFPAMLVSVMLLYGAWGTWDARRCRVSILDVGEGSAVLVQTGRERRLVDTGEGFLFHNLLRQLRAQGVNRLDALILTHADAAHIGATSWVLKTMPVHELWIPDPVWMTPQIRQLLAAAIPSAAAEQTSFSFPKVRRIRAGDSGEWPGTVSWEVLWPEAGTAMRCADDASLVLRVARYGASVLLTGDLPQAAARKILSRSPLTSRPEAAVLLAASHGTAEGTSDFWLQAVRPDAVLVSAGPHAEGRHPDRELVEMLARQRIPLWRTDEHGGIHVDFLPKVPRWPARGYRIHADKAPVEFGY